ncbi:MAG: translation elongation factor-like protein [Candidatus Omnitrophota bacterium]|jgi:putative protease
MPSKKKVAKKKTVKRKVVKRKPAAKKTVKKTAKKTVKKTARKAPVVKKPKENIVGKITHYFPHVRAAVIKLKGPLAVGDTVKIKGHTTDFNQKISSLQIDRTPIVEAKKGQEIGLLVDSRVRQHDVVIKI